MIEDNDPYWELNKALSFASSAHRFAEIGVSDLLDLNFINTCRQLLPDLLKKYKSAKIKISELEQTNEELEERISIMLESVSGSEGWDG